MQRGQSWVQLADLADHLQVSLGDLEEELRRNRIGIQIRSVKLRPRRRSSTSVPIRVISLPAAETFIRRRRRPPRPARPTPPPSISATPDRPPPRPVATSMTRALPPRASDSPLEDDLPDTPRALAAAIGIPVETLLTRLNAAGLPARVPDEPMAPAWRRLARALATDRPPPTPDADPTASATPPAPADPVDQAHPGLPVDATTRLDRDHIKALRAHLHSQPPPNLGQAVRSTRSTITFWAHEDALEALTTVDPPAGSPLELGFIPPAGWLLFARCTDLTGRPDHGDIRGLSWQWILGDSTVQAFTWHSPSTRDRDIPAAHAFEFRLDEPWPQEPEHTLLARWWTLLGNGWIDPEPPRAITPPPPATPAPPGHAEPARRPVPEVRVLRWRTPRLARPNTAGPLHRPPAGARRPPARHTVRAFTRMAWVGPGRQQLIQQIVPSHERGGAQHPPAASPTRPALIVYELRAPTVALATPHPS